ncbi:uncharacterized protein LOC116603106 [Nematostella vectensis]|uniref:uncharacterized protein LOC116603106 n=1 Tax=Nematostella vectensis TaxID=45351 RepID=UPI0020779254|nr:uncharacterized protein LOC116603106 [Nematostella vectensis]
MISRSVFVLGLLSLAVVAFAEQEDASKHSALPKSIKQSKKRTCLSWDCADGDESEGLQVVIAEPPYEEEYEDDSHERAGSENGDVRYPVLEDIFGKRAKKGGSRRCLGWMCREKRAKEQDKKRKVSPQRRRTVKSGSGSSIFPVKRSKLTKKCLGWDCHNYRRSDDKKRMEARKGARREEQAKKREGNETQQKGNKRCLGWKCSYYYKKKRGMARDTGSREWRRTVKEAAQKRSTGLKNDGVIPI